MTGLFELERIGHYDDGSGEKRLLCGAVFRSGVGAGVKLRAAAYRELTDGFAAVRREYETTARSMVNTPTGRAAQSLLWFHEADSNAFLAAHADMKVRLYLDGSLVGEGQDPYALFVFPVTVPPGKHEIEAEVTPLCPGSWHRSTCGHTRPIWCRMGPGSAHARSLQAGHGRTAAMSYGRTLQVQADLCPRWPGGSSCRTRSSHAKRSMLIVRHGADGIGHPM